MGCSTPLLSLESFGSSFQVTLFDLVFAVTLSFSIIYRSAIILCPTYSRHTSQHTDRRYLAGSPTKAWLIRHDTAGTRDHRQRRRRRGRDHLPFITRRDPRCQSPAPVLTTRSMEETYKSCLPPIRITKPCPRAQQPTTVQAPSPSRQLRTP